MAEVKQKCPIHPAAKIIPGLEAFYCYECRKYYSMSAFTDRYAKWRKRL